MAEAMQRRGLAVEVTLQEVPVAVAALQEVPLVEGAQRVGLAVVATLRLQLLLEVIPPGMLQFEVQSRHSICELGVVPKWLLLSEQADVKQ